MNNIDPMSNDILKLLSFRVYGKYAHFRKFYTNASSLSYFVPPRTVIIGMLASILKFERDSYYDVFNYKDFKISVSVTPGTIIRKQMQSLNYLHPKYHNLLAKGSGKAKNMHSQCKLELLIPEDNKYIDYTIYAGITGKKSLTILNEIELKIRERDLGYGIYLGQRQFLASIDEVKSYSEKDIHRTNRSDHVDSICIKNNCNLDPGKNLDKHIIIDQMPIHMKIEQQGGKGGKTINPGRTLHSIERVVYEKSGRRIFGSFKNCYQVKNRVISFY